MFGEGNNCKLCQNSLSLDRPDLDTRPEGASRIESEEPPVTAAKTSAIVVLVIVIWQL
jgi:hypothetical protein